MTEGNSKKAAGNGRHDKEWEEVGYTENWIEIQTASKDSRKRGILDGCVSNTTCIGEEKTWENYKRRRLSRGRKGWTYRIAKAENYFHGKRMLIVS